MLSYLLLPANAYWLVHAEAVGHGPFPTTISLFPNVLFTLFFVVLLNLAAAKWWKPLLSRLDLAVMWGILCMGSSLASLDQIQVLVPIAADPYYFGVETTQWLQHFGDEISRWLVVTDKEALLGFFRGNSSLYELRHIKAWATPMLVWTVLWSFLVWGMMAINALLSPRWLRKERLTYPVVQVPLELINHPTSLLKSRVMWAGFLIGASVTALAGLHALYPAIPAPNVRPISLHEVFTERPWNAIGWTPITFFPFVIGLGFLMPTDLMFSCWFFYWYWKAQQVFAAATGLDQSPGAPWINPQTFGAVMGLALALLYSSRFDLGDMWRRALKRTQRLVPGQPMGARASFLLLFVSLAVLVAAWSVLGVRFWLVIVLFVSYYLMGIAITRIRVEFGSPVHDLHVTSADYILPTVFGPSYFYKRDLVGLTYYWAFNRAQRAHEMPQHAEALKVAEQTGLPLARMNKILLLTVPIGLLIGIWAYLHIAYDLGSASKFTTSWWLGFEGWSRADSWINAPARPDHNAAWGILVGFLSVLFLYFMKLRFVGWPFHPIGYPISNSFSIQLVWMPLLIAWLAKIFVMRHGGLRSFRAVRPFFIGLVLGDVVLGCFWSLLGAILKLKLYSFWGQW